VSCFPRRAFHLPSSLLAKLPSESMKGVRVGREGKEEEEEEREKERDRERGARANAQTRVREGGNEREREREQLTPLFK
jgi:hypothetical protein